MGLAKKRDRTEEKEGEGEMNKGYEQMREKRMRENMERMKRLGIMDLAKKLKEDSSSPSEKIKRNPPPKKTLLSPSHPPRRSSRLVTLAPISYSEKRTPKKKELREEKVKIFIKEGSKPEIYTEEDEMLLGDCKEAWTLCVDGYGKHGDRIYDPYLGKSCHQCRQKTLGHRTSCSKCTSVQGQFCGDCLYTRYGENVLEANEDPSWVCPVCRGICNCSRCRRVKGWEPTGQLYTKVIKLGYKSVAHYLIETRRSDSNREELDAEIVGLDSDERSKPQPELKDDVRKHSDDDYDEDGDNNHDSESDQDSYDNDD